ncbi:MAG: PDZ domain-containing protein, partial [Deltaproteobacteria bacterium]|nr:PDZ domain-containing protein [Deltaproteobacteria bacterium]
SSVRQDGPAAAVGLRRGDVVKEIDRKPIKNIKDYNRALTAAEKNESVLFLVMRGNNTLYVVIKPKG